MTDLGTFRQALQAPVRPGDTPVLGPLDIDQIVAKGRRLRRRRRATVAGATMGLAAAVVAALTSVSQPSQPSVRLVPRPPAAPARSAAPSPVASLPSPVASPASPVPSPDPVGAVIPAGTSDAAGELVFYAVKISLSALPHTTFGIMAGHRDALGHLTGAVETNETAGSGTAAGFHAVEAPMGAGSPSAAIPEFGYYAGPAATITGTVAGHQVKAHTARWSRDPGIVIFWFPNSANPAGATVQHLAAYDQAGHQLPTGSIAGRG